MLNGDPLPWKKSVKHVGVTLHNSGSMEHEVKEKRARLIQRCMELNEEFDCLGPEIKMKLFRLYNMHLSGSNCWSFNDVGFQQLCNSYNVNVRIVYNLPRETHCWLTEEISGGKHAKQQIYKRYVKFVNTLANSSRDCVWFLFKYVSNDVRSQVGGNISRIRRDTGIPIIPGTAQPGRLRNFRVYSAPDGEEFRLPLLASLLAIREDNWTIIFNEESDEFEETNENDLLVMINDVCSS